MRRGSSMISTPRIGDQGKTEGFLEEVRVTWDESARLTYYKALPIFSLASVIEACPWLEWTPGAAPHKQGRGMKQPQKPLLLLFKNQKHIQLHDPSCWAAWLFFPREKIQTGAMLKLKIDRLWSWRNSERKRDTRLKLCFNQLNLQSQL